MTRKRISLLVLGILTIWSLIYFLFFMLFLAGRGISADLSSSAWFIAAFDVILSLQYTILLVPALLVFYLVCLYATPRVPSGDKPLWAIALVSTTVFAMPVFWYLYLWRPSPRQV